MAGERGEVCFSFRVTLKQGRAPLKFQNSPKCKARKKSLVPANLKITLH